MELLTAVGVVRDVIWCRISRRHYYSKSAHKGIDVTFVTLKLPINVFVFHFLCLVFVAGCVAIGVQMSQLVLEFSSLSVV